MITRRALDARLVERLAARYPGVRIVDSDMTETHDGRQQQNIRFQAPLELLKAHGLLTEEMIRRGKSNRCELSIGDAFSLNQGLDRRSTPGHWDLSIYTGAEPRERDRVSVREAQRVLKRIAKISLKGREARHG